MGKEIAGEVVVTVTGVRARTHLVYAASYLSHAASVAPGPVRVVFADLEATVAATGMSESDVRTELLVDPRLVWAGGAAANLWQARPGRRRVLLSIGAPGLRAWVRLLKAGRGRAPEVVVVDEGIGSYGNARTREAGYRRQGGAAIRSWVRARLVATGHRALTDVHWSLYRSVDGHWEVDERVAGEFRRRRDVDAGASSASAVYLTQPWPEVGVMTEARYVEHLRSVRQACEAAGLSFAISPHPAERVERYSDFALSPGDGPAEFVDQVQSAEVVLGASSTALLNLAAVFGQRVLRVKVPELATLDRDLSGHQASLLDAFLGPPVEVGQLTRRLA